jgi:hypothetical protein
MCDDIGVHMLGQYESDRYPFGKTVRIGICNVRQSGGVREAHDNGRGRLLEVLSDGQIGSCG